MSTPKVCSRARLVCLAATFLGLLCAHGCNLVAPIYFLVHGPEKVPKSFTLDRSKTTVVFIDDRMNNVPRRSLRVVIGEETEKAILKQKLVKDVISTQSAMAAAGTDHDGKPMSITEIGAAVKAQIVVYATVDSFSLTTDGTTLAPVGRVRVKVIDAVNDTRVWPEDPQGHVLTVRPAAKARELPTATASRYQLEDELAKQIGGEIAELFYDHEAAKGFKVPE